MGDGIVLTCSNCSDFRMYYLGIGFAHRSLERVLELNLVRSKKSKAQIEQILATEEITETYYAYTLFKCDRCKRLHKRFYIQIKYNNGSTFETIFRCSSCNKILTRIELTDLEDTDWLAEIICPVCQQKSLQIAEFFHWD